MPKVVDHEQRRHEIAEAVWRIVLRDGVDRASVRAVAVESGWSVGSLRHYFQTQDDLLTFAMDLVVERVTQRVAALRPRPEPRESAEAILCEILPLDRTRRAENAVWFAFSARARVDARLRPRWEAVHDQLRLTTRSILTQLAGLGVLRDGLDLGVETNRLHAMVDGLALHALVRPTKTTPVAMKRALATHLDELTRG